MANAATLEIAVEVDAKTGKLKLKALGDTGKNAGNAISSAFDKAGRSANAMDRQVKQSIHNYKALGGTIAAVTGIGGLGMLAKNAIDTASSFEQLEMRLDVLTSGKGRTTLDEINKWALKMPIKTKDAVDAFVMMNAMGLDPTIEKMQILVDTGVIFGDDTMKRVARALGQMQSLGKLSAEELNQLSEAGINARKYLKKEFGMTVEELQQSGIKIESVIQAIMDGMEREFKGASQKGQETWRGMTTAFQSYWMELNRKIMAAGVFDYLKNELNEINYYMTDWIENNDKLIQQEVPKYIESLKDAISSTYDFVSSNDALFEFGLIGLIIGGKKGALVMGALGYTSQLMENLDTAIQLTQLGLIEIKDIAKSFYSNAELSKLASPYKIDLRRKELTDRIRIAEKYKGWDGKPNQSMIEQARADLEAFESQLREIEEEKIMRIEKSALSVASRMADVRTNRNAGKSPVKYQTAAKKAKLRLSVEDKYFMDKADQQVEKEYQQERDRQNNQLTALLEAQTAHEDAEVKREKEKFEKLNTIHQEYAQTQKNKYKDMQEAARSFAVNTEYILGDYLYNGLMGKWENIGVAFQSMIARMGAQFAASQLMYALFGQEYMAGKTNSFGGVVGGIVGNTSDGRKRSVSGGVSVNIINQTGAAVGVGSRTRTRTVKGEPEIDLYLKSIDNYIASGIKSGNSATVKAFSDTYKFSRVR